MAVKREHEKSEVMKNASNAATRIGGWSPAKKEFARRVTSAGASGSDQISLQSKSGGHQQPPASRATSKSS
jgi:hypothetical protein